MIRPPLPIPALAYLRRKGGIASGDRDCDSNRYTQTIRNRRKSLKTNDRGTFYSVHISRRFELHLLRRHAVPALASNLQPLTSGTCYRYAGGFLRFVQNRRESNYVIQQNYVTKLAQMYRLRHSCQAVARAAVQSPLPFTNHRSTVSRSGREPECWSRARTPAVPAPRRNTNRRRSTRDNQSSRNTRNLLKTNDRACLYPRQFRTGSAAHRTPKNSPQNSTGK